MITHLNMCIEIDFIVVPYVRITSRRLNKIKYSIVQLIQQILYNVYRRRC